MTDKKTDKQAPRQKSSDSSQIHENAGHVVSSQIIDELNVQLQGNVPEPNGEISAFVNPDNIPVSSPPNDKKRTHQQMVQNSTEASSPATQDPPKQFASSSTQVSIGSVLLQLFYSMMFETSIASDLTSVRRLEPPTSLTP